jgi:hypothetical protein
MADDRLASISGHAQVRLAQRNLSPSDIDYVFEHGRRVRNGKAVFVHLGKRDIPADDRRLTRFSRLEGTVLVLDAYTGLHLTTAYRNRRTGIRDIKRKLKRSIETRYQA